MENKRLKVLISFSEARRLKFNEKHFETQLQKLKKKEKLTDKEREKVLWLEGVLEDIKTVTG